MPKMKALEFKINVHSYLSLKSKKLKSSIISLSTGSYSQSLSQAKINGVFSESVFWAISLGINLVQLQAHKLKQFCYKWLIKIMFQKSCRVYQTMFDFSRSSGSTPSHGCQCPQYGPGKGNKFSFHFRTHLPILQCSINAVKYSNSIRCRKRKKKANKTNFMQ